MCIILKAVVSEEGLIIKQWQTSAMEAFEMEKAK